MAIDIPDFRQTIINYGQPRAMETEREYAQRIIFCHVRLHLRFDSVLIAQ